MGMTVKIMEAARNNNILRGIYRAVLKGYRHGRKLLMNAVGYLFVFPLGKTLPKKNLVVLTSRFGDFEGNLKYLFLAMEDFQDEGYSFVFLSDKKEIADRLREKGLKAWYYRRISSFLKMLRAKVVIVDGNEWAAGWKYFFLSGAKVVQIWHGTGLKAIGLLKPNYQALGTLHKFFRKESTRYDMVVLSSEKQVKTRGEAFHYKELLVNGLPRNDVFFNDKVLERSLSFEGESLREFEEAKKQGKKIITYTPTWRKHQEEFHQLDVKALDAFGKEHNILWVIKLHYKHDCDPEAKDLENVVEYDKTADIYPLLAISDALITDYSSIYLDYLLLNKPVVFYPYDEAEYVNGERALLRDYDEVTPGPRVYTQEDLHQAVRKLVINGTDPYKEERDALRKEFFSYVDGDSTKRLWNAIKMNYLSS